MKCSDKDEKMLCNELKNVLNEPITEKNIKKAYRKFTLKNHPDKFAHDMSSSEKKKRIDKFKQISGLFNDCSEVHKDRSHPLCSSENKKFQKDTSAQEKSTKTPKVPKVPKKKKINADCVRRVSNWSFIRPYHKFERKNFDKVKFLEDLEKCSPKLVSLLDNIKNINERDKKIEKKNFKHVIYSDIKQMGHGIKILASALISAGFECCTKNKSGKLVIEESVVQSNGFGLLVSTTLYGQNFLVKNKNQTLKMFNERPGNIHGEKMGIILLDNGYKEGIDLYDVKYVHIFEPQTTEADFRQVLGRSTRFCGQKGLKFIPNKGWKLDVYTYHLTHKLNDTKSIDLHDIFMENSNINLDNIKIQEELEKIAIESSVDYDLNYNVNKFSFNLNQDDNKQFGGTSDKFLSMSKNINCDKDVFKNPGTRTNKSLPFSLTQMNLIYETFDETEIMKKPSGFSSFSSFEKRQFFASLLRNTKAYCERLVTFVKDSRFSDFHSKPFYTQSDLHTVKDYFRSTFNKDEYTSNEKSNEIVLKNSNELVLKSGVSNSNNLKLLSPTLTKDDFEYRKNESFEQFKKRINEEFSKFKYDELKVENLCNVPEHDSTRIVEFTPSQNFISHYFTPKNKEKGLLVWHSVGTGKTCTAIATKSKTWEREGYTILWVTRTTLKNDIWKNMYEKVCDYMIREKLKQGKSIPKDLHLKKFSEIKKHLGVNFLEPVSFKQFSNTAKKINKGDISDSNYAPKNLLEYLVSRNGIKDPLSKTLIIIDESHKLLSNDLIGQEKPDFNAIKQCIHNSYSISGNDSCKILLMTATPFLEDPKDFIKLFNLIIGDPNERIDENMDVFATKFKLTNNLEFKKDGIEKLKKIFQGKISFLDRRYDPRQFTQPVFHKISSKMSIPQTSFNEAKAICEEEFKISLEDCKNIEQTNIQKYSEEKEKQFEKELEGLLEMEKNLGFTLDELVKKIEEETSNRDFTVSNAPRGTKQEIRKQFSIKINNFKTKLSELKTELKKLKKRFKEIQRKHVAKLKSIKTQERLKFNKCEKKEKITRRKCLKNAKIMNNEGIDQSSCFKNKCDLNIH